MIAEQRLHPASSVLARRRLHVVVAAVVAAAVVGAGIGVDILAAPSATGHVHGSPTPDVGRVFATSFGVMSVDRAARLEGSGARQLARLGGDGNTVAMQVAVTLTNLSARTLRLLPTDLRLRTGSGASIDAVLASTWPGRVGPLAAKKVLYRFAVPDEPVWAEYSDPRGPPIVVALGRPTALAYQIPTSTAHSGH